MGVRIRRRGLEQLIRQIRRVEAQSADVREPGARVAALRPALVLAARARAHCSATFSFAWSLSAAKARTRFADGTNAKTPLGARTRLSRLLPPRPAQGCASRAARKSDADGLLVDGCVCAQMSEKAQRLTRQPPRRAGQSSPSSNVTAVARAPHVLRNVHGDAQLARRRAVRPS